MSNFTAPRLAGLWRRFRTGLLQLPGVGGSLDPKTEAEAELVEAQLDMLRTSFRLFDYALPLAGAVVFVFARFQTHLVIGLWWAILCANCALNEFILSRPAIPGESKIERAGRRARRQVVLCMVLTTVWSSIAVLLWNPDYQPNLMFVEFLLCCTLAAVATTASLHVISSAIPLIGLSAAVLIVPTLMNYRTHMIVFGIANIFVALMLGHAWVIQLRTIRMLRLENERAQLIDSLRKAKIESDLAHHKAVAAGKAKAEFLANMSHELRTPLNAIIGFSDIIRSKTFGDSNKYAEYGGFIHQSGHVLLALIGDILELAKIESGRKLLHPEPMDLASVVTSEIGRMQEEADAAGVSLHAVLPPNAPLLNGDLRSVRQILSNLISNAVKFTPATGRVDVAIAVNHAQEIGLSVSDTGIGIAREDHAYIFDRFGRGEPNLTRPGTGLGLPIVKGLAAMHDARIDLDSELGEGTKVTVTFPAKCTVGTRGRRTA
jgi:two-component system cell cycle sensor histidine kinase PleC